MITLLECQVVPTELLNKDNVDELELLEQITDHLIDISNVKQISKTNIFYIAGLEGVSIICNKVNPNIKTEINLFLDDVINSKGESETIEVEVSESESESESRLEYFNILIPFDELVEKIKKSRYIEVL